MEHNFDLATICLQIFKGVEHVTTLFVGPLFLIRIGFAQTIGDGEEIKNAIKGVFVYFILVAAFPSIMTVILEIPNSFFTETIIPSVKQSFSSSSDNDPSSVIARATFGIAPKTVVFFMEAVSAVLFWIVWALQALISIFLTAIAPVVFLLTCLLGIGISNKIFFGLLVMTSTWPLAWYGFDQALHYLFQIVENSFGRSCIEAITLIFKGIVPIMTAYLSVNSGPGRMIVGGMGRLTGGGRGLWNKQPNYLIGSGGPAESPNSFLNRTGRFGGMIGGALGGIRDVQKDFSSGKIGRASLNNFPSLDQHFRSRAAKMAKVENLPREVNTYAFDTNVKGEFLTAAQSNHKKMTESLASESKTLGVSTRHQEVSHDRANSPRQVGRQDSNQLIPAQSLYKNEVWAISCEYASQGYTSVKPQDYSNWSSKQLRQLDRKWNPKGYSGPQNSRAHSIQKQIQSQNSTKNE